jgi:O-antigen biosynthesis protein
VSRLLKAWRLFHRTGWAGIAEEILKVVHEPVPYWLWCRLRDRLTPREIRLMRKATDHLSSPPKISVLMPLDGPSKRLLKASLGSLSNQIYPSWEVCLGCEVSDQPGLEQLVAGTLGRDPGVVILCDDSSSRGDMLNRLLAVASGEFILVLRQGNLLSRHALFLVAHAQQGRQDVGVLYGDEDSLTEAGKRFRPVFKPAWNEELFLSEDLLGNFCAIRTTVARALGGFRPGIAGKEVFELALRAVRENGSDTVRHVPFVLSHSRLESGDEAVAGASDRSQSPVASKRLQAALVQEHLSACGEGGSAEVTNAGRIRIRYPVPDASALVSVIIPTRNRLELLRRCLDSLCAKTRYNSVELIIVDNQSDDPATLEYLASLDLRFPARVLTFDYPFNFATVNNFAAGDANGEFLCLLNNDIEVISSDWLDEMVAYAARKRVGAVGAMLYYPNDTVQHGGVVLNGNAAAHLHAGIERGSAGYMGRAQVVQELSAVTAACMVVRKSVWNEVGGMDGDNFAVEFNDVDFCLKLRERGYRNIWTPHAELYHHESVSRGRNDTPEKRERSEREKAALKRRWGTILDNDPAWNPNLTFDFSEPSPSLVRRVERPWLQGRVQLGPVG